MDCPICGAIAAHISTALHYVGFTCPLCGDFNVATSVLASGQLQTLPIERRGEVLGMARRAAAPRERPMITSYMLGDVAMR